jgi:hypothetical protein
MEALIPLIGQILAAVAGVIQKSIELAKLNAEQAKARLEVMLASLQTHDSTLDADMAVINSKIDAELHANDPPASKIPTPAGTP